MYYIYHIPGVKIGVTDNLHRRMLRQGNPNYVILEEHTDIYEVSYRERELQEEYGYSIDSLLYFESVARGTKGGNTYSATRGKHTNPNGGLISGKNNKESGQTKRWSKSGVKAALASPNAAYKQKKQCAHCGYVGTPLTIGRYHNENCKKKD